MIFRFRKYGGLKHMLSSGASNIYVKDKGYHTNFFTRFHVTHYSPAIKLFFSYLYVSTMFQTNY